MFDLLFDILILLSFWLGVFALYFCVITFFSTKSRRFLLEQKYNDNIYSNNLIVIIYAHNNEKTLVQLVETLNKQKYPRNHYQTHVILDNCSDNSSNILEFVGGVKIWRLGDNVTVGKDEAVTWLLERLASSSHTDAFIFLNANRSIDENFLQTINTSLHKKDILVGTTEIIKNFEPTFLNNLIYNYNLFQTNIFKTAKGLLNLPIPIDSDICVIRQKVLEEMQAINFKGAKGELKYSAELVKKGFFPVFNPLIRTEVDIHQFRLKHTNNLFRFKLFLNMLKSIFMKPFKYIDFTLSLIAPSALGAILGIIFLYVFGYYLYFDLKIVTTITTLLAISLGSAVLISKTSAKSILSYPFYKLFTIIIKLPVISFFVKLINRTPHSENIDKMVLDVQITDGKNTLDCKMDLISEDGLAKTIFRFKKKKYTSSNHIRMYDAIKDIIDKLNEHGLRMKICQGCGYFTPKIDGSTNMIKGHCHRNVLSKTAIRPDNTLLWNTCPYFIPQEAGKIIELDDYRANKQD